MEAAISHIAVRDRPFGSHSNSKRRGAGGFRRSRRSVRVLEREHKIHGWDGVRFRGEIGISTQNPCEAVGLNEMVTFGTWSKAGHVRKEAKEGRGAGLSLRAGRLAVVVRKQKEGRGAEGRSTATTESLFEQTCADAEIRGP